MSTFLIDKTNGAIIVNGVPIPFDVFLNDKSQTGKSAYEDWLLLPGNAGKSIYEFINYLKGSDGVNGEDAYVVTIDTDKGTVFKNAVGNETITLTCVVSKGGRILSTAELEPFAFVWRRDGLEVLLNNKNQVIGHYIGGPLAYGGQISRNITNPALAKYIIVGSEDVNNTANFTCDVLTR